MQKKESQKKDSKKKGPEKKLQKEEQRKKKLALDVISRLKKEYPGAECTLDYDEAWKLLVSVRLAAQCTDARVNVVVEKLYEKFPDVEALAAAGPEEIEEIVKPCGLGHSKARDISACMRMLRDQYDGKVPDDFDALLTLPGVGREEREPDHGRCFREAGYRDRHPLHPAHEPHRPRRWNQRTEKGGDGALEDHSSGGRQ